MPDNPPPEEDATSDGMHVEWQPAPTEEADSSDEQPATADDVDVDDDDDDEKLPQPVWKCCTPPSPPAAVP